MKMNPEVKAKWLAGLRSGEYRQGSGQLKTIDNRFCCLGVLCDIHAKETGTVWVEGTYLGKMSYLPPPVAVWAGGDVIGGEYRVPNGSEPHHNIGVSSLNDRGSTFEEIANLIEKDL